MFQNLNAYLILNLDALHINKHEKGWKMLRIGNETKLQSII